MKFPMGPVESHSLGSDRSCCVLAVEASAFLPKNWRATAPVEETHGEDGVAGLSIEALIDSFEKWDRL